MFNNKKAKIMFGQRLKEGQIGAKSRRNNGPLISSHSFWLALTHYFSLFNHKLCYILFFIRFFVNLCLFDYDLWNISNIFSAFWTFDLIYSTIFTFSLSTILSFKMPSCLKSKFCLKKLSWLWNFVEICYIWSSEDP